MKKEELKTNMVVVLANGKQGIIVGFNNIPTHIIFNSFTNPVSMFNDNLEHKNPSYNIVKIYDGSKALEIDDILRLIRCKKCIENLPIIWEK